MKLQHLALLMNSMCVTACVDILERRGPNRANTVDQANMLVRGQIEVPEGRIPIGEGDRFDGGKIAPRGFSSSRDDGTVFDTFLNFREVNSAVKGLANEFDNVKLFNPPEKTYENNTLIGVKVGGSDCNCEANAGFEVFVTGGVHPRERGSTDHLIYFVADLLWAEREGTGLNYFGTRYTNEQVKQALSAGMVLLPMVNPDGAIWDHETDSCWRKNRNPASAEADDPRSIGVDLNRNFDVAWNVSRYFAQDAQNPGYSTPGTDIFTGTGPASEPETQNVQWVFDAFPDVGWYVDVHSLAGTVTHGWFVDSVQDADPDMNWRNEAYDDVRGIVMSGEGPEGAKYGEYMAREDRDLGARVALRMSAAASIAGEWVIPFPIPAMETAALLAVGTPGVGTDYAYSRHLVDSSKKKVMSFNFEFGLGWVLPGDSVGCQFYPFPGDGGYEVDMRQVGAGLMEMLLAAAEEK